MGVTTAVISPGSRNLPLSYVANEILDTVVVVDERDAGFCGYGMARTSTVPVLVITTSGSAPTHLFPSVVESSGSSVPMIVMSADRPHSVRGRGAPQTIDQIDLFSSAVRYFLDAPCPSKDDDPRFWSKIGQDLFEYAMGIVSSNDSISVPGPVHLNIGFDETLIPDGDELSGVSDLSIEKVQNKVYSHDSFSEKAKNLIINSKSTLVTVGRNIGTHTVDPQSIERLNSIPVLADVTSSIRHISDLVTYYDFILRMGDVAELKPDLILQIGEPLTSKKFNEWVNDVEVISIKPFENLRDPYGKSVEAILVQDLDETLLKITTLYKPTTIDVKQKWLDRQESVQKYLESLVSKSSNSEPTFFHYLGQVLEKINTPMNVVLGSSMPVRYAEWLWHKTNMNSQVFSNRGTCGIDGMLSSTFGLAYGNKKTTIAVLGDLTFAHDVGFLAQCASLSNEDNLRIIFVVVDNKGGAIFKHLAQGQSSVLEKSYQKLIATPTGIDIEAVSNAFGAHYSKIEYIEFVKIESLLIELIDQHKSGVSVLHVEVDHNSGIEFMGGLARQKG